MTGMAVLPPEFDAICSRLAATTLTMVECIALAQREMNGKASPAAVKERIQAIRLRLGHRR